MPGELKGEIYTGLSGLQTPIPKRSFPEPFCDKSRLCYYSHLFNSIEINSSFYRLPLSKTIAKWAAEVPAHFKFTFKLWKEITHNKGLVFKDEDVERFMEAIGSVGDKKGSLLVQFPPSLQVNYIFELGQLLQALRSADADRQWDIAVEFRHSSWYEPEVYDLLESFNAGIVFHDIPASLTPLMEPFSDFVYVRYHGPNGGYRGSYPDDFLSEYVSYINEWRADGKKVYVYFNNTMGAALNNLITLNRLVAEE